MSNTMPKSLGLSRRRFLTSCAPLLGGSAMAGLTLINANPKTASAAPHIDGDNAPGLLIDVSRCQGCDNCQRACAAVNGLPSDAASKLNAETYTVIEAHEVAGAEPRYVKRACMHCLHPACVSACPVGALHQDKTGLVVADTSKCIGCRYCQYACPFGVPRFEWENTLGVMRKCAGCAELIAKGQAPACASACPTGAVKAGPRGSLLEEAHARIKAATGKYVNGVYGELEAGGASRLYISDVPFESLGLPVVSASPVPIYAESVVTRTPAIALTVAALSTATYAFMRRRERNMSRVELGEE